MGFDLAKNNLSDKAEVGYEFEVLLPGTEKATGAFITVRGAESKTVKGYQRRKFKEYQARMKVAQRKGKADDDISIEEAEEMTVETAVGRVIGWRGFDENGKELAFTAENATRVLSEHTWIREQVMEASNDITNFQ